MVNHWDWSLKVNEAIQLNLKNKLKKVVQNYLIKFLKLDLSLKKHQKHDLMLTFRKVYTQVTKCQI